MTLLNTMFFRKHSVCDVERFSNDYVIEIMGELIRHRTPHRKPMHDEGLVNRVR